MITQAFPTDFRRYLAVPVLGPMMDRYAAWLFEQQYTHRSTRYELRMAARASKFLKRRCLQRAEDVSEHDLQACYQWFRREFPKEEGGVRVLARFLMEQALLRPSPVPEPSRKEVLLKGFMAHLKIDRGYAPSTVKRQAVIASEFLDCLNFEEAHDRLASLKIADIEDFIRHMAKRMGRVALQKVTSSTSQLPSLPGCQWRSPAWAGKPNRYSACIPTGKTPSRLAMGNGSSISPFHRQEHRHGEARLRHVLPHCDLRLTCLRCRGSQTRRYKVAPRAHRSLSDEDRQCPGASSNE